MMEQDELLSVLEALIFVSGDPVPVRRLGEIVELPAEEVRGAVEALSKKLEESGSGLQIVELAGGYQFRTRSSCADHVNRFLERKKKQTLSAAALEAVAIIAYKQPVTRAEMEAIRGVAVDGVLKSLLDKRLIKVVGQKEVPGRPNLYGTTKKFLEYFGLNTLKDLPPVEDISDTFPVQASAMEDDPQSPAGTQAGENGETPPAEAEGADQAAEAETVESGDGGPSEGFATENVLTVGAEPDNAEPGEPEPGDTAGGDEGPEESDLDGEGEAAMAETDADGAESDADETTEYGGPDETISEEREPEYSETAETGVDKAYLTETDAAEPETDSAMGETDPTESETTVETDAEAGGEKGTGTNGAPKGEARASGDETPEGDTGGGDSVREDTH